MEATVLIHPPGVLNPLGTPIAIFKGKLLVLRVFEVGHPNVPEPWVDYSIDFSWNSPDDGIRFAATMSHMLIREMVSLCIEAESWIGMRRESWMRYCFAKAELPQITVTFMLSCIIANNQSN